MSITLGESCPNALWISQLIFKKKKFLDNNKISDKIPTGIGNLTYLEGLDMWNTTLSGNIPFEIGKLHKLQYLGLSANNIFGNIPSSLGNLTIW